MARIVARVVLGLALAYAGVSHLAWNREEFAAQVPDWVPLGVDAVVVASGLIEVVLGVGLVALARRRALVGWVVAAFFVAVFPGNVSQFVDGDDAFGLTSDLARGVRLLFQPVLVVWALWSTEAWRTWRAGGRTALLAPQA